MTELLFFLLPLGLIAYTIIHLVRRGFQMKDLAARGVQTDATIIDRQQFATAHGSRRNDRYLRYEYTDGNGIRHTHRAHVVSRDWLASIEGDKIPVVYLPDRPAVSALLADVERARSALQRKH